MTRPAATWAVYWLEPAPDGYRGALVTHAGSGPRPYRERRVLVPDLARLPATARVYVDGRRWRPPPVAAVAPPPEAA
jgi:hypothetical protein